MSSHILRVLEQNFNEKSLTQTNGKKNRFLSLVYLLFKYCRIELLKNSIVQINKTSLMDRFHETKGELIFQ